MDPDIVERLRWPGFGEGTICPQAADEIEALRARVAELEAAVEFSGMNQSRCWREWDGSEPFANAVARCMARASGNKSEVRK